MYERHACWKAPGYHDSVAQQDEWDNSWVDWDEWDDEDKSAIAKCGPIPNLDELQIVYDCDYTDRREYAFC